MYKLLILCIVCQVDDIILCHGNYGMVVYI